MAAPPTCLEAGELEALCRELYAASQEGGAGPRPREARVEPWGRCLRRLCDLEGAASPAACEAGRLAAWGAKLAAGPPSCRADDAPSSDAMSAGAFLVLALFCVTLAHLLRVLRAERVTYKTRKFSSCAPFVDFLKYRFSLWFAWVPGSSVIVLCVVSMGLIIFGGVLHSAFSGVGLSESLWLAWIWVVAPDAGSSSAPGGTHVGMLVSIGGMLIFATLVSLVTSAFEEQLEHLRQGTTPVVEGDHTVIVGWKPMVCDIIGELCQAAESRGGSAIVVLADIPKPEVEAAIQERGINFRRSVVSVRSGRAFVREDLERVAVQSARCVLVLSPPNVCEEDADARTSRVLLTLSTCSLKADVTIVVECCLVRNTRLFHGLVAKKSQAVQVACVQDFVGELMVESSRQRGSSAVIHSILGFEGDEFYVTRLPGLAGWSFGDLLFAFPRVVPVGFASTASGGEFLLAPPTTYVFQGDEDLLFLAEDVADLPCSLPESDSEAGGAIRETRRLAQDVLHRYDACTLTSALSLPPPKRAGRAVPKKEFILVFGWNRSAGSLLMMLDLETAPGSEVWIYSPSSASERDQSLVASQRRRNHAFSNIVVKNIEGMVGARYLLEQLPLESAARLFFLADNSATSALDSDGNTVAVILQVRDILEGRERTEANQAIVPQILLTPTEEAVKSSGLSELVNSSELSARVLAGLCETPRTGGVIAGILAHDGARICIRKLSDLKSTFHHRMGGEVLELNFHEVMALAEAQGEIAVGWSSRGSEWELNPKDKDTRRLWNGSSRIATVAPSKTGWSPKASPKRSASLRSLSGTTPLGDEGSTLQRGRHENPRAKHRRNAKAFERDASGSDSSEAEPPQSRPGMHCTESCKF